MKAEEVPVPKVPTHSPFWLRKAHEVGLGENDIAAMSAEELRQAVTVEIQSRGFDRSQNPEPRRQTEEAAVTPPPDVDSMGLDSSLASWMKAVLARLDTYDQREMARGRQAVLNRLDAKFAKDKDVFGEGATAEMDKNSIEYARRQQVIDGLEFLAVTKRKTTLDADFERYAKGFRGLKPTTPKPAETEPSEVKPAPVNRVAARTQEWEEGTVDRPTHGDRPVLPKGVARAKEVYRNGVAQFEATQRELGQADENDELPG